MVKAIVACDAVYGIGKNNSIPWHHKDDMRFFKTATIGWGNNYVVMGRKTKESIPNFPLQKRKNLVISTNGKEDFPSIEQFQNWLNTPKEYENSDVWIIGGASIYNQCFELGIPQEIWMNIFDKKYGCDTYIDIKKIKEKYIIKESKEIEDYTFQIWERSYK